MRQLRHGAARATVDEECGGTVRDLALELPATAGGGDERARSVLVDPELRDDGCETELFGGRMLVPFADRVIGGRYRWDGVEQILEPNDTNGRDAIHGFLFEIGMNVVIDGQGVLVLSGSIPGRSGYRWPLDVTLAYKLRRSSFSVTIEITNRAATPAPVMPGWHPYFALAQGADWQCDGWALSVSAESVVETDGDLVPTGSLIGVDRTPYDFRRAQPIGALELDVGYRLTPDARAGRVPAAALRGEGVELKLWCNEGFAGLQVFTPPGRRGVALEPVVGPAEALRHARLGRVDIESGATFRARTTVTLEESS